MQRGPGLESSRTIRATGTESGREKMTEDETSLLLLMFTVVIIVSTGACQVSFVSTFYHENYGKVGRFYSEHPYTHYLNSIILLSLTFHTSILPSTYTAIFLMQVKESGRHLTFRHYTDIVCKSDNTLVRRILYPHFQMRKLSLREVG